MTTDDHETSMRAHLRLVYLRARYRLAFLRALGLDQTPTLIRAMALPESER